MSKCPQGYTPDEVEFKLRVEKLEVEPFWNWMNGQTQSICDGRSYNHNTEEYEPTVCANNPHGFITYFWDVQRYIDWKSKGFKPVWD